MNNINNKQNSPEILDLLFSARVYMNKASLYKNIEILLFVSMIIIQFYFKNTDIILFLISLIILVLIFSVRHFTYIGAITKESIDSKLFNINNNLSPNDENMIIEYKNKAIRKNNVSYKKAIKNNGQTKERGVRDWYEIRNTLSTEEAIIKCQEQNIYWDKKLVINYLFFLILSFLVIITIFYFNRNSIYFISNIPNIYIIFADLFSIFKYREYYARVNTRIEDSKNFKDVTPAILSIQKDIFERRKGLIIPDYLHKIFSKILHQDWKEISNNSSS